MNKLRPSPPKLFLRFFQWFCHPRMLDYIEGDLIEVYERNFKELGKRKADRKFILDVLLLFRPGIIRPIQARQNVTPVGMYKNYFKIGWRTLLRNKQYSLLNIAGLAFSLTVCILIFGVIKLHLSFEDFHPRQDRIYRIVTELQSNTTSHSSGVPTPLPGLLRENESFAEQVIRSYAASNVFITVNGISGQQHYKEPEGVVFAEGDFFDVFNFPMKSGDANSALTHPNSALLTEKLAKKYFGDENPIGKSFLLDGKYELTVRGVLKDIPSNTDFNSGIYVSFSSFKSYMPWLADEGFWMGISSGMQCYIVLQPHLSPAEAEEALSHYTEKYPISADTKAYYSLQPLSDIHYNKVYGGTMDKSLLWILAAIGFFLLLTACVNFVNLATARALHRSKEVGVRKVMGGLRSQLFWQFIFETALISFGGILIALTSAYLLIPVANERFGMEIGMELYLGREFLLFLIGLFISITLLAGCYPAIVMGSFTPISALKGKTTLQQFGGFNTRRSLIVVQFVIAQVMVISAVVIMGQMRYAINSDLGFDKEAIVMVKMGNDSLQLKKVLKNELMRIPGVEQVSLCNDAPAAQSGWLTNITLGKDTNEFDFLTNMKMVDEDYLSTFGLRLVSGRNLIQSDTVREILVNEALLYKLGITSSEEALGTVIKANGGNMTGTVVGIVRNFHGKSFHEQINPTILASALKYYESYAIKINLQDSKSTMDQIETVWKENYTGKPFEYEYLDDRIARFYKTEGTMLTAVQLFSGIAIFIGSMGLYGLISFMVVQKTKEVGIRKVMGSSSYQIVWIFGKEFARLIVLAFLLAAPLGWYLMKNWLQNFEFKIEQGIGIYVLTLGFSFLIAALTIAFQTIRAARANPAISLRTE
ncbi:ABC transporter permease [Algoriphagus sp. NG3]|uniref:ABC transporter permease n=1 Tax=Algoriphagus sp. NG3 TaxID=3097546 RepID=UPI002A81903A|nr:ABC transporter permease [Algoriphagus sp. NG3]WPR77363.1 ABC transporter permease [Algoriphagus sp. NG3]